MYAIFEDGSRQYRAEQDGSVVIDYRDLQPGQQIELTKVLLIQSGSDTLVGQNTANISWPRRAGITLATFFVRMVNLRHCP